MRAYAIWASLASFASGMAVMPTRSAPHARCMMLSAFVEKAGPSMVM